MSRIIKHRVSAVNAVLVDTPQKRVNNVLMRATEQTAGGVRYQRLIKDLGIKTPTEFFVFLYGKRPEDRDIAKVANWIKRGIPAKEQARVIARIKEKKLGDLNALWLDSGKEPMWHARPPRGMLMSEDQAIEKCDVTTSVPCLDLHRGAANPAPSSSCTIREISIKENWLQHHLGVPQPHCLCIREMMDGSMHPIIKQGEFIFIDTCTTEIHFDGIYVVSIEGELYIRHVARSPGKLKFSSEKPARQGAFEIKRADYPKLEVHGKVVGSWALRRL